MWQSAFLRKHIGFVAFSAGSTLGLRAPDCAKEPLALWTLFMWGAAWVRFTRREALGYNEDLTGSNKWRPHCGWPDSSYARHVKPALPAASIS